MLVLSLVETQEDEENFLYWIMTKRILLCGSSKWEEEYYGNIMIKSVKDSVILLLLTNIIIIKD